MLYELVLITLIVWLIFCLAVQLIYSWWKNRQIGGSFFDFRNFGEEYVQLVLMPITIPIYYLFVKGKEPKE